MEQYVNSLIAPKRRQPLAALPLLPVGDDSSGSAPGGGASAGGASASSGGHPSHDGGSIGGGRAGNGRSGKQRRATIGGAEEGAENNGGPAAGSTLVSMLLPTRNGSAQRNGNLTALDQIFVVMMEPSETYTTYSCRLPSPVLV